MTMPRHTLSDSLEPQFPHRSRGVAWPPRGGLHMADPGWVSPCGGQWVHFSESEGFACGVGSPGWGSVGPSFRPLSWQVANCSPRLIKLLSSRCAGCISEHLAAKRDWWQPPDPALVLRSSRNAIEYKASWTGHLLHTRFSLFHHLSHILEPTPQLSWGMMG